MKQNILRALALIMLFFCACSPENVIVWTFKDIVALFFFGALGIVVICMAIYEWFTDFKRRRRNKKQ